MYHLVNGITVVSVLEVKLELGQHNTTDRSYVENDFFWEITLNDASDPTAYA